MKKANGRAWGFSNPIKLIRSVLAFLNSIKTRHHAIVILGFITTLVVIFVPRWQVSNSKLTDKERIELENASRTTLVQALGGIFFFSTAYFSWRNLSATEDKQITERFSKAVELLGNADIHVRLGAIYALERISKDSEKDYWQVMEILTAYLREKSPHLPKDNMQSASLVGSVKGNGQDSYLIPTDIQAVLNVLTRRTKAYHKGEEHPFDLSRSDLRKANLRKVNFQEAILDKANLQEAYLFEANFQAAYFEKTNLQGVILTRANLQEAYLQEANLEKAYLAGANLQEAFLGANLKEAFLSEANLQEANLEKANLQKAIFWKANLKGAYLLEANLQESDLLKANLQGANIQGANFQGAKNLTPEQVKAAKNWDKAKYDLEFLKQLGIPETATSSKVCWSKGRMEPRQTLTEALSLLSKFVGICQKE